MNAGQSKATTSQLQLIVARQAPLSGLIKVVLLSSSADCWRREETSFAQQAMLFRTAEVNSHSQPRCQRRYDAHARAHSCDLDHTQSSNHCCAGPLRLSGCSSTQRAPTGWRPLQAPHLRDPRSLVPQVCLPHPHPQQRAEERPQTRSLHKSCVGPRSHRHLSSCRTSSPSSRHPARSRRPRPVSSSRRRP